MTRVLNNVDSAISAILEGEWEQEASMKLAFSKLLLPEINGQKQYDIPCNTSEDVLHLKLIFASAIGHLRRDDDSESGDKNSWLEEYGNDVQVVNGNVFVKYNTLFVCKQMQERRLNPTSNSYPEDLINISGIEKNVLLAALVNNLSTLSGITITEERADEIINEAGTFFKWDRVVHASLPTVRVDFSGDTIDGGQYQKEIDVKYPNNNLKTAREVIKNIYDDQEEHQSKSWCRLS